LLSSWQFDPEDRTQVRLDTTGDAVHARARPAGSRDGREDVRLERWAPNETIWLDASGGAKFLVLEGSFADDQDLLHIEEPAPCVPLSAPERPDLNFCRLAQGCRGAGKPREIFDGHKDSNLGPAE
jgi:hypothetical protein